MWYSGLVDQQIPLCVIFFQLMIVGLWAGWDYIGLGYIYHSNTIVATKVWYSGLVDRHILLCTIFFKL